MGLLWNEDIEVLSGVKQLSSFPKNVFPRRSTAQSMFYVFQ